MPADMIIYSHGRELPKRKGDKNMADWMNNPEIHAEDFEELEELWASLAEEEGE